MLVILDVRMKPRKIRAISIVLLCVFSVSCSSSMRTSKKVAVEIPGSETNNPDLAIVELYTTFLPVSKLMGTAQPCDCNPVSALHRARLGTWENITACIVRFCRYRTWDEARSDNMLSRANKFGQVCKIVQQENSKSPTANREDATKWNYSMWQYAIFPDLSSEQCHELNEFYLEKKSFDDLEIKK